MTRVLRWRFLSPLKKGAIVNVGLLLLLLFVFLFGCNVGQYRMDVLTVLRTLFGMGDDYSNLALFSFRLPRLCLAVLVGIGMGVSGVVMQNLLHNDLASPGTLGVSDGSGLFVTLYVALLKTSNSNPLLLPILALLGGLLSSVLIFLLSYRRKKSVSPTRMIMTGVAMSSAYGAIGTFLMYILDQNQIEFLQRWQSGELWGTDWSYISVFSVWLVLFVGVIYSRSRSLNAIGLGYDVARGLGVGVTKEFLLLAFSAVALSSASVAFGGNFFFLGLIAPHIAKRLVGEDSRVLFPASGILGAILILLSDMVVMGIDVFANIPTGIVVSILSVPYFVYLLLRK